MSFRRVAANATWLTLNQALSYVLPLVTTPILTRGFGPETYGTYSTALAYGAYAALLVTYGFNFYGPRAISLSRDDPEELRRLYAAIMAVQSVIAVAVLALFGLLLLVIDVQRVGIAIFIVLVAQAAVVAATPVWLFAGLQDLRNVSLAQFVGRLALFAFTIAVVDRPADLLPLATAMLATAGAVFAYSLREARRLIGRSFPLRQNVVRHVVADAAPFFWSSLAVSVYASSSIIIVSAVLGPGAVGYFALADKIRVAAVSLSAPITQAVYPFFNQLAQAKTQTSGDVRVRRAFVWAMLALSGTSSMAMFWLAPEIIRLLGGRGFDPAVLLLRIMAPVPLMIALSNIVGRQTLIPYGHIRLFTTVTFVAAVLGVISITILLYLFGLPGAAWSGLLVESFVTVAMVVAVARRGLLRRAFAVE
jgi:polysaccharide transporter, PST family